MLLKADYKVPVSYEDTVLDRANLERYARKVARELDGTEPTTKTVQSVEQVPVTKSTWLGLRTYTTHESRTIERVEIMPGSRWYLDRRVVDERTDYGPGVYDENHWVLQYYLEWNGDLVADSEYWEDGFSGGQHWGPSGTQTDTRIPMSDSTILLFDHDFMDPSRRVRVDAKGVGLSLRLKELLESRPPSL